MVAGKGKYRLGLDLGTNSIGWAAIQLDDQNEPSGLLDMGVRIFPDGRDEQSKQSNAVDRRLARGQRRRRDRYLNRRSRLMRMLVECGLMPADKVERKDLEHLNPYELRARALIKPLCPFELGRALFHLNQRRGFKSNRRAGGDEREDGQVRMAINHLRQSIDESGARTLGEYLACRHKKGEAVRARPAAGLRADRAMYEEEFEAIRVKQEPHHGLSPDQWDELRNIIFFQRPLRPVEPGWCQFEFASQEPRVAKALPVFQEFRMLQEVNNLKMRQGTEPERFLNQDERERAMRRLRSGSDIRLSTGRDDKPAKPTLDLGLPSGAVFNLAAGGRKSIKGDETAARLAKPELFGKKWLDLSLNERNAIVHFLLDADDPEFVNQKAVSEWGLNAAQANSVANVPMVQGYGNLSEKAIRKILPHLEQGRSFAQAVQDAGYPHHSDFRNAEPHDLLPYYGQVLPRDAVGADPTKNPERDGEPAVHGRIANPTVHIGLGQLRRLVNRLTETYGKPQDIVVELARELKMNREQKRNLLRQQHEGRKRNDRFRAELGEETLESTPDALRKLRLWEEQGPIHNRICPYTGKQISFVMVMSAETEVDHILPFSRTLDNSAANMVVCMADANRRKGNQTPHEAFGDECLEYVKDFPLKKRWRFEMNAMERFEGERDFLDRQLSETQYLSRTARTYLAYLYDEQGRQRQRVRVIPGRMTALLRRGWGLEGMLDGSAETETPRKTRDDHRHHAVDAFVVANTTQGLLQRFADAAGSGYQDAEVRLTALVPPPWDNFDRIDVQPFLDKMTVSYRPDHGTRGKDGLTTGQLHEATAYGVIEPATDGRHQVVLRKSLSRFTAKDLENVPDLPLRSALHRLWDETGGKVTEFAERAADPGVVVNNRRQKVRRVRLYSEQRVIRINDADGEAYKGYLPGGNEFADIWRLPSGGWQTVVVSTFDANQRGFNAEASRPHPAAKRLMRLQINDMGALGEGINRRIVRVRSTSVRAQKGRDPRISVCLDLHNEAQAKETEYSANQLREQGFRKVRVDEIGRVYDRGPFKA